MTTEQRLRELPRLVMDRGPAGSAVRMLLPVSVSLLVMVGVLVWGGHRIGLFGLTGAVLLFAAGNFAIVVFVVFWLAQRMRVESTIRRRIESEAKQGGLHDRLTGLSNRAFFLGQLVRRLALAERRSTATFAVFCLSLDHVAESSQRLGRKASDRIVVRVAEAITATVRTTDLVARLGGVDFAILAEELAEPGDVNILAQRLVTAIPAAVAEIDPDHTVKVSIGIAFKAPDHTQAGDLLRAADAALKLVQISGESGYRLIA
jgi:diguanylate cyclase (GGDEF)-like protein